jgi:hypothetical protein
LQTAFQHLRTSLSDHSYFFFAVYNHVPIMKLHAMLSVKVRVQKDLSPFSTTLVRPSLSAKHEYLSGSIPLLIPFILLIIVPRRIILQRRVQHHPRIVALHPSAERLAQLVPHELLDGHGHLEHRLSWDR